MQFYVPSFYGDIRLTSQDKTTTLVRVSKASPTEKEALASLREKWSSIPSKVDDVTFSIAAPLSKVQRAISKALKPSRMIVAAVTCKDGKIEEVREEIPAEAKSGVALAAPARGCPHPEFEKAHHRATEVLMEFLDPQQLRDYETRNQFVSVGAETGHRYLLTSRNALGDGMRSFYDLDEKRFFCVHDWYVPAPEELLALHMFLKLPGRESYLRELPPE